MKYQNEMCAFLGGVILTTLYIEKDSLYNYFLGPGNIDNKDDGELSVPK